jgi:hypothetical protein
MTSVPSITCNYCGGSATLVTGAEVYPHRNDLGGKHLYLCKPCDAWVGCHPGTTKPLGRLANAELRAWKSRAHAAFDPLWRAKMLQGFCKKHARDYGYKWLSEQLGIARYACHIGMFDVEQCKRVVEICKQYSSNLRRTG